MVGDIELFLKMAASKITELQQSEFSIERRQVCQNHIYLLI